MVTMSSRDVIVFSGIFGTSLYCRVGLRKVRIVLLCFEIDTLPCLAHCRFSGFIELSASSSRRFVVLRFLIEASSRK